MSEAQDWSDKGKIAWERFEQTRETSLLDEAVACNRRAVDAAVPRTEPGRAIYLYHLLFILNLRYEEKDDPADLNVAIGAGREAVALARGHAGYAAALGALMLKQFRRSWNPDDINECVDLSRRAMSLTPTRSSDGDTALETLGAALQARFAFFGSVRDLEECIQLKRTALAMTPRGKRKMVLAGLASSLGTLFERTKKAETLDAAIALSRRSVNAGAREGRDQAQCLDILGGLLERSNESGDLRESLETSRQALALTPHGHPDRPRYVANLSVKLSRRSAMTGNLAHIGEAVRLASAEAETSPEALGALAGTYLMRYELSGKPADLDEAVVAGRRATELVGERSVRGPEYNSMLGSALFYRFRQFGAVADIDESIARCRVTVEGYSAGPGQRASEQSVLGMLLLARYERTGDPADLMESVAVGREAVANTVHEAGVSMALSNLANSLATLYLRDDALADLNEAVDMTRRAIAADRSRTTNLARYNSNLAHFLLIRFRRTKQPADLDESVDASRTSVELISENNPERSRFLANLSGSLDARFKLAGLPEDRNQAVVADIEASMVVTAPPVQRLGSAKAAAASLMAVGDVSRAADMFVRAVRLLPEVSPRRLGRDDQQHALRGAGALAGDAASVVLIDERVPMEDRAGAALAMLEAGRAVLIGQALDGRDDLSELRRLHPELAASFVEFRDLLSQHRESELPTRAAPGGPGAHVPVSNPEYERNHVATEFARLLSRIRELDGFATFGLPPTPADLLDAAREGPVAVLNVTDYGSHAILVTSTRIFAIPLARLSRETLSAKVDALLSARRAIVSGRSPDDRRQGMTQMSSLLEWLWDVVAGPVLETLGFKDRPADGIWPRVWWVPCGLLSLLPVHAAGYHDSAPGRRCPRTVIDRVVSSYAPSLRALIHTRRTAIPPAREIPRVLAVAMPTTPGLPDLGPLPNVPREIEALASHFAALTVLNEATAPEGSLSAPIKSIVLSEMLRHPVAHFACHGHSDSEDPSRSLLLLRDHANDPLTAGSLGPVALEEAQLAYLSACSTASTLSTGLLDESIHLASAFQIAGFPHVISTLWEIGDKISVQVANDFYAGLCLEGGVFDSRRAPYALHQAIRAARIVEDDSGVCTVRHPFLWASYIHVGA